MATFVLDEVLSSSADSRDVIKTGNYVFRRVSGFEWDELLGAPHKVIRHPGTPKYLFWELWDRIQTGILIRTRGSSTPF
ncbi:hypothetical protein [Aliiroseovarius subalbicans]|uniref:hypothetical protein n=1 Tax=Aliiroseovarius subalbicans TaxID=2925840 RepID=UPI001F58C537|nr:hypothetical protein [Aliiroseovarius subalbicans]MCI2398087.1 hypothetical protein [Aliiroseovarius subalbicans]